MGTIFTRKFFRVNLQNNLAVLFIFMKNYQIISLGLKVTYFKLQIAGRYLFKIVFSL